MSGHQFGPGEVWFWPSPPDGELVPDHPPVCLGTTTVTTENDDDEGDPDATTH